MANQSVSCRESGVSSEPRQSMVEGEYAQTGTEAVKHIQVSKNKTKDFNWGSVLWKRKNERPADRDGQWGAFFSTKFIFSIIIDKSIERVSKTVRDILK